MKKSTKKQLINIFIVILLFLLTLTILLNSTNELNKDNLNAFFTKCNPLYIGIAFLCWAGFVLFEAISLHIILRRLGHSPKFTSSIAYATSDTYYSAITPSASGGQPASAYYMIKDGVSAGAAGFSLIFNLIGYTSAILIIGILAFIFGFNYFLDLSLLVQILIIFGVVAQIGLLLFFIACMKHHVLVKQFGYFIINALCKFKLVKKKEKWLSKIDGTVDKYKNCYDGLRMHKTTFIPVILFNTLQRISQILISVFICKAATDCSLLQIFVFQSFVTLGYNCIPLPGGSGVFEYLYYSIFALSFPASFIVVSMIFTRIISYYFSMIASGMYTLIYHVLQIRRKNKMINLKEDCQSIDSNQ